MNNLSVPYIGCKENIKLKQKKGLKSKGGQCFEGVSPQLSLIMYCVNGTTFVNMWQIVVCIVGWSCDLIIGLHCIRFLFKVLAMLNICMNNLTCMFIYRTMADFVTWTDTSAIKKHVLNYSEMVGILCNPNIWTQCSLNVDFMLYQD